MCIFLGRRALVGVCVRVSLALSCGGVGRTPLVVPFLAVVGVKGESIRGCLGPVGGVSCMGPQKGIASPPPR